MGAIICLCTKTKRPVSKRETGQAGRARKDPLLPQPHGAAGRIARAQKELDGHGLRARLRGRRRGRTFDQAFARKTAAHWRQVRAGDAPRSHGPDPRIRHRPGGRAPAGGGRAALRRLPERTEHITTGAYVHKGEPLMRVYSSALSAAAAQYVTDLNLPNTGGLSQDRGARQRLENLGVPDAIIAEIAKNRQGSLTVTWPAPRDGFVVEHNVVEGMQAKAGDILFRIADLSVVWVLADVAERDLGLIEPGQTVAVTPRGYPGRTFTGKIGLIYPVLNKDTRTARVRIELANPDGILKPNMYADAVIESGSGAPVIAVPESAVINGGAHQFVIVDKGNGRFEPRPVKTGVRGNGFAEIKEGISEGDRAVTAANFLIDAESNLRAALQSLAAGDVQ